MTLVKVDGILVNNDSIRKEQLKRVYWKDKIYTDFGGGDYVRNISVETKEVSPIGDGRDLLNYTFDGSTDYSREMLKHYMSNGVNHPIYETSPIPDGDRYQWEGDYYETFNPDNTRKRVADVKLYEGERQIEFANEGRFLEEKYITPELLNFYGNKTNANLNIVINSVKGRLDGFIHVGDGRLADIKEANVSIVDNFYDILDYKSGIISQKKEYGVLGKYLAQSINDAKRDGGKVPTDVYIYDNYDIKEGKAHLDTFGISQNTYDGKTHVTFNEGDTNDSNHGTIEKIVGYSSVSEKGKGILSKTAKLFNEHKISTMIGRFHSSINENDLDNKQEFTDTAKSIYGNSHGRNLLKKNHSTLMKDNDYENPYCRVWTYHHQYDKVSKMIRPFRTVNGENLNPRTLNPYNTVYRDGEDVIDEGLNGLKYLEDNTVLGKNGFVNIAPKKDGGTSSVEIKKCMFSIENLAWKDVPKKEYYLSDEQRGPNGGRIMWFPPYDLNFQESVSVNWNQNTFIGRGEPVFTYSNTNRNGVLSFVILVDHPSIMDNIPKNNITEDVLTDDDILRYFAGCDVPIGFNKGVEIEEQNKPEDNKKQSDESTQAINEEKSKRLKFNVYFPNNYSGNGVITPKPKDYWQTNGSSDRLWYQYLLFGKNTEIPDDEHSVAGYGYEMTSHGVTNEGDVSNPNNGIPVAVKTSQWEDGEGKVDGVYYVYRVDYDRRQMLVNVDKQNVSRGMNYNTSNYVDNVGYSLNKSTENQNDTTVTESFTEVLAAMVEANPNVFDDIMVNNIRSQVSTEFLNSERYQELVDLFRNPERIKVANLTGSATRQDDKNHELLAKRRCRSINDLLSLFLKEGTKVKGKLVETTKLADPTAINTLEAKRQKMASCEILYDVPEIAKVAETGEQAQPDAERKEDREPVINVVEAIQASRYENESEYFKNIDKEDPLIHKKILDKFKYFNPAFHSISPEGFNARLTFLQQCTRQGHTVEASSKDFAKTAGNLSFGRMPVCVLRLGDFINTRIIINGMSINYDASGPMQWDLNPEGIGVQPMYAKVSLQITVLGGQSLEGPINRLQNAVTFNYYANTGVYDNRSDRINSTIETVPGGEVRIEKSKEESVDKYNSVVDDSEYVNTKITYRHIFTPAPKHK